MGLHVKYLLFLSDRHKTQTLSKVFQKNPQISQNVIKTIQQEPRHSMRTDGWTDRQK